MHYFQTNWKDFTVAYMIPNFEMIRLHLDKEDSLLFSFFFLFFFFYLEHYTQNIQTATTFLALLALKMV